MAENQVANRPHRPDRVINPELEGLPTVEGLGAEEASTTYSHYRTGLSNHRTHLSEHRTDLSEYRTDLSDIRTELSMRRSGMGLQRTRMGADRTLMAVIRTSLSLIGFGFTIYQFFQKMQEAGVVERSTSPRNIGMVMIILGIITMGGGIWRHIEFSNHLRAERAKLIHEGLIHGESAYPISITLIVSICLMLLGIAAIGNMFLG